MVDSKQKGARAELAARDILRQYTGLNWERIPSSGALDKKHGLKGDLYIPQTNNKFCVEVKHYKDDHLTSKILTSKNPQLLEWWAQTVRESNQIDKTPLLLFKFDRSKWFVACNLDAVNLHDRDNNEYMWIMLSNPLIFVAKLEDWLQNEDITWTL